jgi:hypothetical protein
MRVADVSLWLLRLIVDGLVALSDALASPEQAAAAAHRAGVPPLTPSADWHAKVRAAKAQAAELDEESDAIDVLRVLEMVQAIADELYTAYLSVTREELGLLEATTTWARLVLPILFQMYRRHGTSHGLGAVLALLVLLDRRLAEASSEATFDERLLKWGSATLSAIGDGDEDGTGDAPEVVATIMTLGLVMTYSFVEWFERREASSRGIEHTEPLHVDPTRHRAVFRLGFDDAAGEWPPLQREVLSRAITAFFPPAVGQALDDTAFKKLDDPPIPWMATGTSVTIAPLPVEPGVHGGGLFVYVEGDVPEKVKLTDALSLEAQVEPGAGVLIPLGKPFVPAGPAIGTHANVALVLRGPTSPKEDPDGIALALEEARIEASLDSNADFPVLTLTATLRGLEVRSGADTWFPFRGKADLLLRFDTRTKRLQFEGGAGLEVRKRFAVEAAAEATLFARLALKRKDELSIEGELLADLVVRISRHVTIAVGGVGVSLSIQGASDAGGSVLGLGSIDYAMVGPNGIGVSVAIGPVRGGGMFRIDDTRDRVSGVVELEFGKLRLGGVGVYESRDRWLFLATFERKAPGPAFLPQGIGILVARGRQADQEAMRSSLGTGELDAVLMPKDLIANEARVLAALDRFFPPGEATVVGIMMSFRSPEGALTARIGVLVELPYDDRQSVELHLIAIAQLTLPSQKPFTLEGVGFWNLDRGEGYLALKLRDAKLWGAEVTGGALIFHGDPDGDGPNGKGTWISVGGFFPGYPAPGAGLAAPPRVGMLITHGENVRLEVTGYIAWTPSSIQFGIRGEFRASYLGFGFDGHLGLDALVTFDWRYVIKFEASMRLKVLGRTLAAVAVHATLEAMDRYRLSGYGSYDFLCFSGKKHFDVPLGERDAPALPTGEVVSAVAAAVALPEGWRPATAPGVVLASRTRGVTFSPDGLLSFEQNLVPLGVPIELYGMQRLAQPTSIRMTVAPIGGTAPAVAPRVGEFAPGLYFDLTSQEDLRAPVTVQHESGFELSMPLRAGASVDVAEDWEEVIVDPEYVPEPAAPDAPQRFVVRAEFLADAITAKPAPRPVTVRAIRYRIEGTTPAAVREASWMSAYAQARATPRKGAVQNVTTRRGAAVPIVEAWR